MINPGDSAERQRAEPVMARVPSGAPSWVSPELITHTIRVWQPYYERLLTSEDALEILMSTGRLVEFLTADDR
jgi:hypothetical protein